jgi:hypothetical protein
MGGGRGNAILISTPAIVGIGTTITNTKSIVPKANLFILLSPDLVLIRAPSSSAFFIPFLLSLTFLSGN